MVSGESGAWPPSQGLWGVELGGGSSKRQEVEAN